MGHSRPRWKNAQRKSGQEDKGDAIPDELLGLVFLRLTSPLDLVRAAFACRSWRKVIAAEDFRVLSARHGAPSSIVAGHYHISFSHCHYRPSGLLDTSFAIPDLLGLVFLRLTSPLDLVRAAFACRSWRKVIAAEDFRVLSARHGAPSSIVAGHYHISFSHCHYRPSGLLPHFVPSSSSCWAGVAANNLALDFLPRAPNGDLSLELADSRGGLLLLADFDHTEHGKPFEQPSRLVVCDPLAGQYRP
ncbi:hypothetical protein QYE76_055648 [Lolium multiflorum]|uniref:F-box domain-containing protein n=1 Tax=Lolium multiflorum TaxID=4521 RepID=A0AAD8T0N8_LOLMU|nr:hypothetical protein QYE76_055648 [Lolium multiflorum]